MRGRKEGKEERRWLRKGKMEEGEEEKEKECNRTGRRVTKKTNDERSEG